MVTENLTILVLLLVLLIFAGVVVLAVTASRKEKQAKAQIAQSLGLTPIEPDAALAEKIVALHRTPWSTGRFRLRNVAHRLLPDGELFLFDLVDTGGDPDSLTANQAVAIRSSSLRLPPFQMFPKVNAEKYGLGALANKIIEWGTSKLGTPVSFPQFPDFEARYSVTSGDPAAVQRFFNDRLARYFANTEYYTLRAADDMFVFAEMEPGNKPTGLEQVSRRIQRALGIYRLL